MVAQDVHEAATPLPAAPPPTTAPADWLATPPSAQVDAIRHAAHLAHFVYWWQGPDHYAIDALSTLERGDPALQPPSYGPLRPFANANEVHDCVHGVLHGLGDAGARVEVWVPELHAVLIKDGARLLLAFRGTFDACDVKDDALCRLKTVLPYLTPGDECGAPSGRVHAGFWRHFTRNNVHKPLLKRLHELAAAGSPEQPVELMITGHSLGGSAASLVANLLLGSAVSSSLKITLITFGSPRTGDAAFVQTLAGAPNLRHWRVQNELDLITRIPYWLPWPGVWAHHQTYHIWLSRGRAHASRGAPILRASIPLNLLFWMIRWLWRDNKADVRYHKMGTQTGYVRALANAEWTEETENRV